MTPGVRSIISRLLIASLALCVSVVAASFWPGVRERVEGLWPTQVPESAVSLSPGTFTPVMSKGGDWHTSAGDISEDFYLAWDGSEVRYSRMDTGSPGQAVRRMWQEMKILYPGQEAGRIDVLDESGKKVGEMVRGLRRTDTEGRNRIAVLWTSGSDFFILEGGSPESVGRFEQQNVKQ